MPSAPLRPCTHPGCPRLVGSGRCDEHQRKAERERGSAHARGYDARWRARRLVYLRKHPLCVRCEQAGRVTPARVVDHIVPHKGDPALFWDESNWQSLCDHTSPFDCHGKKTATEDGGFGRVR